MTAMSEEERLELTRGILNMLDDWEIAAKDQLVLLETLDTTAQPEVLRDILMSGVLLLVVEEEQQKLTPQFQQQLQRVLDHSQLQLIDLHQSLLRLIKVEVIRSAVT